MESRNRAYDLAPWRQEENKKVDWRCEAGNCGDARGLSSDIAVLCGCVTVLLLPCDKGEIGVESSEADCGGDSGGRGSGRGGGDAASGTGGDDR